MIATQPSAPMAKLRCPRPCVLCVALVVVSAGAEAQCGNGRRLSSQSGSVAVPGSRHAGGAPSAEPATRNYRGRISIPGGAGPSGRDLSRSYLLQLPPGYDRDVAHPLLLVFHGVTSTASIMAENNRLGEIAGAAGWIVVHPEGMGDAPPEWQPPSRWNLSSWQSWNGSGTVGSPGPLGPTCAPGAKKVPGAPCYESCGRCADHCWWTTCVDDVKFVAGLLDHLQASLCVDSERVVATGFSNGAVLLYELAGHAEVASRLSAIAPVAGLPNMGFYRPPAHPGLRFFGLWGRADHAMPAFESSPAFEQPPQKGVHVAQNGWYYVSAESVLQQWTKHQSMPWPIDSVLQTPYDGELGLACWAAASEVDEGGHLPSVVMCAWDGIHAWAGAGNCLHAARPSQEPLASRLLVHVLLQGLAPAAAAAAAQPPPHRSAALLAAAAGASVAAISLFACWRGLRPLIQHTGRWHSSLDGAHLAQPFFKERLLQ